MIKYFSYYLIYAPNPLQALEQFCKLINIICKQYEKAFKEILNYGPLLFKFAKLLGTKQRLLKTFLKINRINFYIIY